MNLTTRVSAFFLATLAIILAAYSLVFYSVTRKHIDSQFNDELRSVLGSLVAAVEVEETEVKWQPLEHTIDFGIHQEFGEIQWVVLGDGGSVVEQALPVNREFLAHVESLEVRSGKRAGGKMVEATFDGWAMMRQQLSAPDPERLDRELDEFDQLTILVGRSTAPRNAILFRLFLLVLLLPLLVWSLAALLGRWVVRRALRPVTAMSDQARVISGTDFHSRLTCDDTGDELAELGAAFNRLLDRQQAAFEQQRRFTGDAAHELRTPITVLLGQIEVTLRRPRTVEQYQENLELLRSQTRSLQEIVESLLFLARCDADSSLPALRTFGVKHWIDSQAENWNAPERTSDLQIENLLDDDIQVRATPALLGRVVSNLVFNAFKYSEVGQPVVVRAIEKDNQVLIQVIDSGPGIEESDLPKLFDPFFRSSAARQQGIPGTGLGLAIAARIAEALGGSLDCESTPGEGSCFTLRLPEACPDTEASALC